jgi:hypothetical protein
MWECSHVESRARHVMYEGCVVCIGGDDRNRLGRGQTGAWVRRCISRTVFCDGDAGKDEKQRPLFLFIISFTTAPPYFFPWILYNGSLGVLEKSRN